MLVRRVDVEQVRSEGDAVKAVQFPGKDAAFKTGMHQFDLWLIAILLFKDIHTQIPQSGGSGVRPGGIIALDRKSVV